MSTLASLFDQWRSRGREPAPASPSGFEREALFHAEDDALGNGWLASSIELKRGLDVSEQPMDTLPGELLDAFFKR